MRHLSAIPFVFSLAFNGLWAAEQPFAAPGWAIEAAFAGKPSDDVIRTPLEQGESVAARFFYEISGERYMLVRFTYPVALRLGEAPALYDRSIGEMMRSRPGDVLARKKYSLGPFEGERLVLAQRREKTTREVRLVVVGSSLYVISGEWPPTAAGIARSESFFNSVKLRAEFQDYRTVEERERWRVLRAGPVRLRYDAASWYRDPTDQEPGVFNLLRVDRQAEAQLIVEDHALKDGDIETAVLKTAREGAERVTVEKSGKKYRGSTELTELLFNAKVDQTTYTNHGYFYSGPAGSVQLRGWATEKKYPDAAIDITELLDGLSIGDAPNR